MNGVLWILQGLLAAIFLLAGGAKLTSSRQELIAQMPWVEDFSANVVKAIGALEVLGAIGLILPGVTGVAPVLVPVAAVGLGLEQLGAMVVHARRSETRERAMNLLFIAMAAVVAWGRFGDYSL